MHSSKLLIQACSNVLSFWHNNNKSTLNLQPIFWWLARQSKTKELTPSWFTLMLEVARDFCPIWNPSLLSQTRLISKNAGIAVSTINSTWLPRFCLRESATIRSLPKPTSSWRDTKLPSMLPKKPMYQRFGKQFVLPVSEPKNSEWLLYADSM